MLWARRQVRVYASSTMALVEEGGGKVKEVSIESLTLAEALSRIDSTVLERSEVEVHLSGRFCPAVTVAYPQSMRAFRYKEMFAQAVCAQRMGVSAQALKLRLDPAAPDVAAPIGVMDLEAIVQWTRAGGARLISVRPLWSVASEQRFARGVSVVGVREPDSLTLMVAATTDQSARALSVPVAPKQETSSVLGRVFDAIGTTVKPLMLVSFALSGTFPPQERPDVWANQWSVK